jgi:hypothetical protein
MINDSRVGSKSSSSDQGVRARKFEVTLTTSADHGRQSLPTFGTCRQRSTDVTSQALPTGPRNAVSGVIVDVYSLLVVGPGLCPNGLDLHN